VGIALRFGVFYGADSAHTIETVEAARAGRFAVPGPADAFWPAITTDDAASAVVAALVAPSGLYNVADDRPLRRSEHAAALAAALGTGPLQPPPMTGDVPEDLAVMLRSQRVTSQLFVSLTGWKPRFPSAWDGWPFVVAQLGRGAAA
jgi:nucleoside-diphosphate-sugar epimerase